MAVPDGDSVTSDVAIGRQDQLNQTPAMVVVYKGERHVLAPVPPYELLEDGALPRNRAAD